MTSEQAGVNRLLQLASDNHLGGRLKQAENIYRQILEVEPNNAEANHGLGLIAFNKAEHEVAEHLISRAIEERPSQLNYYINLGIIFQKQGRLDDALALFKQALGINPEYAEAYFNQGNIYQKQGRLDDALASFKQALNINPEYAEAYNNQGDIYQKQGRLDDALASFKQALSINPNYVTAYNNLGIIYQKQDRLDDAFASFKQALSINQNYAEAYYNLSILLKEKGQFFDSIACSKKALIINPDLVKAHDNLGNALQEIGRLDDALACYKRALEINPDYAEAHNDLGNTLQRIGKLDDALACYKRALEINPDYALAHKNLGILLRKQGRFNEALESYNKALAINPDLLGSYYSIALIVNQNLLKPFYSTTHEDVKKILKLLELHEESDDGFLSLHFALGEMYENCGAYNEAIKHFQNGNRIKRSSINFDILQSKKEVDRIIYTFSEDFFKQHRIRGSESSSPVFIVGPSRAGKTLVEKHISSHKDVFGGGEIKIINLLTNHVLPQKLHTDKKYPYYMNEIDWRTISEIAQEYENAMRILGGDLYAHITNTLPSSYLLLGIIALLFPRTKVIYCRRNAVDNCLAIYFKLFSKGSNNYAYDLKEIAFYYRQYERLMNHWSNVLPLPLYEVSYEDLVQEPEKITPKLIEFLDLAWDSGNEAYLQDLKSPDKDICDGFPYTGKHPRGIDWSHKYKIFWEPLEECLQEYIS
jgi:tetratricopeptide (TPR) repeat protein